MTFGCRNMRCVPTRFLCVAFICVQPPSDFVHRSSAKLGRNRCHYQKYCVICWPFTCWRKLAYVRRAKMGARAIDRLYLNNQSTVEKSEWQKEKSIMIIWYSIKDYYSTEDYLIFDIWSMTILIVIAKKTVIIRWRKKSTFPCSNSQELFNRR